MTRAPHSAVGYVALRGWTIVYIDRAEQQVATLTARRTQRLPVLRAVVGRTLWMPRCPAVATCLAKARHEAAPVRNCSCGLYASLRTHEVRRLLLRQRYGDEHPGVPFCVGEVAMWGRLVLHRHGARAEFAYPRSLFMPKRWRDHDMEPVARELEEAYGIPVDLLAHEHLNAWGTEEWDRLREVELEASVAPRNWREVLKESEPSGRGRGRDALATADA